MLWCCGGCSGGDEGACIGDCSYCSRSDGGGGGHRGGRMVMNMLVVVFGVMVVSGDGDRGCGHSGRKGSVDDEEYDDEASYFRSTMANFFFLLIVYTYVATNVGSIT